MKKVISTPGPWEAVKYPNGWTVRRVGADKNEADVTDTFQDHISLMEGDAKLIAAAPDMAEVLKEVENILEESWTSGFCEGRSDLNNGDIAQEKVNKWREKVIAALAKAGVE